MFYLKKSSIIIIELTGGHMRHFISIELQHKSWRIINFIILLSNTEFRNEISCVGDAFCFKFK